MHSARCSNPFAATLSGPPFPSPPPTSRAARSTTHRAPSLSQRTPWGVRLATLLAVALLAAAASLPFAAASLDEGGPADLLFMFDRSESDIVKSRLEGCAKAAAMMTVDILGSRVDSDDIRIAAISYSGVTSQAAPNESPGRVHFSFAQGSSSSNAVQQIKAMDFSTNLDGWTDASSGFQTARTSLFRNPTSGFRGLKVPLIVIMFTDGEVRICAHI